MGHWELAIGSVSLSPLYPLSPSLSQRPLRPLRFIKSNYSPYKQKNGIS